MGCIYIAGVLGQPGRPRPSTACPAIGRRCLAPSTRVRRGDTLAAAVYIYIYIYIYIKGSNAAIYIYKGSDVGMRRGSAAVRARDTATRGGAGPAPDSSGIGCAGWRSRHLPGSRPSLRVSARGSASRGRAPAAARPGPFPLTGGAASRGRAPATPPAAVRFGRRLTSTWPAFDQHVAGV